MAALKSYNIDVSMCGKSKRSKSNSAMGDDMMMMTMITVMLL